ncbi:Cysteine protease family c01a, partial [Globisporangium splendens]
MKSFLALAAIAVAQVASLATAQDGSQAVDRDALTAEFLRWKASPAGQQAYEQGFVPRSSSIMTISSADEPTPDELLRFQNAKDTIARLQKEQPHAEFSLESPFALLTAVEFEAHVAKSNYQSFRKLAEQQIASQGNTSTKLRDLVESSPSEPFNPTQDRALASEVQAASWVVDTDWQTKGCVTRIKDQGQCGVCAAFATTAALESGYCVAKGVLYELSEQDITRLNGGSLCTEASYPWVSGGGVSPNCKRYEDPSFKCNNPKLGAKFYAGGTFSDHTKLEAVVRQRPVAVGIRAGVPYFQYYKSGVLMGNQTVCAAGMEDHAVLVVGFGTLDGIPYWKAKNQWGATWGSNGYIYVERGYQGHQYGACGIESYAHYPIFVADSDPGVNKRCGGARYGVEFQGSALTLELGVRKAEHCCDMCRQTTGCIAYTWGSAARLCMLLSSVDSVIMNVANVYSASILSKADDLKECSTIQDNTDYPANDLVTAAATSAEECCDLCNRYPACNAYTWSQFAGGLCYLKSARAETPRLTDPLADGSAYFRSGTTYKCESYQFGVDLVGADLSNVASSTATACCGICRATATCAGYSWNEYNGGTCWLKKTGYTPTPSENVISATV